ncbi:MAG TPA: hypothetical protein VD769_07085 [Gaiellaceae bacterium]|nr:hypothetical protein [Gaiellaceae bacterium]
MRVGGQIGGLLGLASVALVALATLAAAAVPAGGGVALVPPEPCSPGVVITDPTGDGHHDPTDVTAAWLSEENAGNLQAVIQVALGNWDAEHDEPEIAAGYVFLFSKGGTTKFVRLSVDEFFDPTYDYGTYDPALTNPFVHEGDTTGSIDPLAQIPPLPAPGPGTAVIDVPSSVAVDGDVLKNNFVLTYDGLLDAGPTWVDVAPGGDLPNEAQPGPSFTVGSCTGVTVAAPASIKGGKTVTVSGSVDPAAEGIDVTITRTTVPGVVAETMATTDVNGDYSALVPVRETTFVKATANGIDSTTRKITVRSTVTIRAVRLRNGKTRIQGVARPKLPGRIQLIKTTAFVPAASKTIAGGSFRFTARKLKPGRWQVIYTPRAGRAVRSISPAVRVR